MARLRASWRTSLPVVQQPRNPQSESIARTPYNTPTLARRGRRGASTWGNRGSESPHRSDSVGAGVEPTAALPIMMVPRGRRAIARGLGAGNRRMKVAEYVGLDVSMKETAVSIRRDGKRIWRGKCASDPRLIAEVIRRRAPDAARVVFETGPLSVWFYHALTAEGLPAICIDARHAKAALDMAPNKTDAHDADGLAQLAEVGRGRTWTATRRQRPPERGMPDPDVGAGRRRRDCDLRPRLRILGT